MVVVIVMACLVVVVVVIVEVVMEVMMARLLQVVALGGPSAWWRWAPHGPCGVCGGLKATNLFSCTYFQDF